MNELFSIFVVQSLLWIVLLFFLFRLIKINGKLKEKTGQLIGKLDSTNKGESMYPELLRIGNFAISSF